MAMEYQQYYAGYQDSAQSWSTRDADLDTANGDDDENRPPEHPIASMQGPFEESIADSVEHAEYAAAVLRKARSMKPKERRQRLLDTNEPNDSYNARWRANPSARYHPLSKVLAQIAFGVHLLHLQLAKSNEEVVRILQKHVDEVDSFIQRTEEDLDLALADIQERIKLLKVPMEHVDIFDIMLDDKQFRASILEGNEIIEKVVHRTAGLMNDLLVDVGKGKESTVDMSLYLARLDGKWPKDDQPTYERFETMRANTDAWLQCFETLQMKGNSLGVALVQLGSMLNIMSKRAAVASKRSVTSRRPGSISSTKPGTRPSSLMPTSRYARQTKAPDKPLPKDPDAFDNAVQATLPKREKTLEQLPYEERLNKPNHQAQEAENRSKRTEPGAPPPTRARTNTSDRVLAPSDEKQVFEDRLQDKQVVSDEPPETPNDPNDIRQHLPVSACATPKRTRSRLKKKTSEIFGDKLRSSKGKPASVSGQDSAYSSRRPSTSPAPNTRPPGNFTLFPTTPSMLSAKSSQVSLRLPKQSRSAPSPLSTSFTAPTPRLKRRSSLGALVRFFTRKKNGQGTKKDASLVPLYELPA